MHQVVNFLVESSVFLGIMASIYFAFLTRLNTFSFNRFFLLTSLLLATVIPFVNLTLPQFSSSVSENKAIGLVLEEISIYPKEAKNGLVSIISNISALQWIYLIGLTLLFARLFVAYLKLSIIGSQNKNTKHNDIRVIELDNPYHAFSFFKWIFINPTHYSKDELQHVINHEKAHANYLHTLDIIILELFLITQWFNPFAWLIKKALKETHEFQADQSVLKQGVSLGRYKALLLAEVSGHKILAANNFNESLTKKRFNMMTKKTTLKTKIIFPLFAFATLFASSIIFSCNTEDIQKEMESSEPEILEKKATIIDNDSETVPSSENLKGRIYYVVEGMPEFPGGEEALRKFISQNVTYPKEAEEKKIQGRVYIKFVISADGYVRNVEVARGVDPLLDQEALRVVESLPKWTPGKQDGDNVNVTLTVPINFVLN